MNKKNNRAMKKYMKNLRKVGMKMSDKYGGIIEVVEFVEAINCAGEIFRGKENDRGYCHVVVDLTNSGGCSEVTCVDAKDIDAFVSQYYPMLRERVYHNDTLLPPEGWHWV